MPKRRARASDPVPGTRGRVGRADLLRAQHSGLRVQRWATEDGVYVRQAQEEAPRALASPGLSAPPPQVPPLDEGPRRAQLSRLLLLTERQPAQRSSTDETEPALAPDDAPPNDVDAASDLDALAAWMAQLSVAGADAIARRLALRLRGTERSAEGALDLRALTDRIARRRSLQPLPRAPRARHSPLVIVLDISQSLAPLWPALRALAQCLCRALPAVRAVLELRGGGAPGALALAGTALLLSDLRSEAARDWLRGAQARGVAVHCAAPAMLKALPSGVSHSALGAVDPLHLQQMLAAIAAVPYWSAHGVLGGAQQLSREGDAWALAWAVWNHPTLRANYSRVAAAQPPQDLLTPGLPAPPSALLRRYRALHVFEPEAERALADMYLHAYLPAQEISLAASYRRLTGRLVRMLRTGQADGLEACMAVRLATVAPPSERTDFAALYSALFQLGHQQLGVYNGESLAMPPDVQPLPGDPAQATIAWRLAQIDASLWLLPVDPQSVMQHQGVADDIALRAGDLIAFRCGAHRSAHLVGTQAIALTLPSDADRGELMTPGELLRLRSCSRPNWAIGWGRDAQGAYVLAPSFRGPAQRFALWENAGDSLGHPYLPPGHSEIEQVLPSPLSSPGAPEVALTLGIDGFGLFASVTIRGVRQKLRWIAPGEFLMGSPEGESAWDNERPQRVVLITQGYWLADSTCTQAFWQALVDGQNPSHFQGDPSLPVERVSWLDIDQHFLPALQAALGTGVQVELPSEAQWEYACRAGTKTAFSFGDSMTPAQANFGASLGCTVTVASLPANPWGLYEMHGNVWEWCRDGVRDYAAAPISDTDGTQGGASARVQRGGSWIDAAAHARSAMRNRFHTGYRNINVGFRWCLRSLSPAQVLGPEGRASGARMEAAFAEQAPREKKQ